MDSTDCFPFLIMVVLENARHTERTYSKNAF